MMLRRSFLLTVALFLAAPATASEAEAWKALQAGATVLFRHANAPGGGDPPGMRIDDCTTQRNLDHKGREQAVRIGEAFRKREIVVGEILSSQWCRTLETASLAFGAATREEPIFNSFFDDRNKGPSQTEAALKLLHNKPLIGARVIITHQVNITAITGIFPASGEGIVLRLIDGQISVIGRINP
jgi:phosphohistidine phosphatase SixA